MSRRDVALQRLRNQRLAGKPFARPEEAVRWLGAVQAQDYAGAKWAVGQRTRGCTDAAVEEAFQSGRIVRTHVLRPTWHFVMPADVRWMLELTAPRVHAASAYYYRQLDLDGATFARSNAALARALEGGKSLTRTELARVLAASPASRRKRWTARPGGPFPPPAALVKGPAIHLLPNYDEFLIAYRDRSASLDAALATELGRRPDAFANHLIVRNGRLIGGWRRRIEKDAVTIETRLLTPLDETGRRGLWGICRPLWPVSGVARQARGRKLGTRTNFPDRVVRCRTGRGNSFVSLIFGAA